MSVLLPAGASAVLSVNLAALSANYRLFQSMTRATVAGVVKANGYGLGVGEVSQTLYDAGCRHFFVATLDEAIALRHVLPAPSIYVLGGFYMGAEDKYIQRHITPVLNTAEDIERWQKYAHAHAEKLYTVIHFDTGMNRLGLNGDVLHTIQSIHPDLILSHFIASEDDKSPCNARQIKSFSDIAAQFPAAQKSLCNSSGLFRFKDHHYDMVRPGYALYGGNPTPETTNPMNNVVSLYARVLQTRRVKKGETVGYNATYTFPHDTDTATIAVGYADGFFRSGSNTAHVYWNGQPCPVRGRVSMDAITIETGHLSGEKPTQGAAVEILGAHQSIDALAASCGTIGYTILTALGMRYRRVYIKNILT